MAKKVKRRIKIIIGSASPVLFQRSLGWGEDWEGGVKGLAVAKAAVEETEKGADLEEEGLVVEADFGNLSK